MNKDEIYVQSQLRLIEALATAERTSRQRLNNLREIVLETDAAGALTYLNDAWERLLQVKGQDSLGRPLTEFLLPEDRPIWERFCDEFDVLPHDRATPELRLLRREGQILWCELAATRGEQGGLVASLHDITERKRAQTALQESESRFRHLADSAPVLIWMSGTDKLCTYFNQTWLTFTGRTLEQEAGNGWADGVYPEDYQTCRETYVNAFDARQPFEMDYRLRRRDGEYRWILGTGTPRYDSSGQFLGYIGSCIDITDRKRIDAELRLKEAELSKLALVASRTDNAVVFTDAQGRIEWVNEGFTRVSGWPLPDVKGRKPGDFLQGPDTDPAAPATMSAAIRAGQPFNVELINYRRDGTPYWTAIEAQPLRDDSGELTGFMAIESDITERKRAQMALEAYSQRLEGLVQERTRELEHNKALLEAIVTTTSNGLLLVDQQGTIRYTNVALARMFGYQEQELIGRSLEELVPESKMNRHRELSQQFIREPHIRTMGAGLDLDGRRKDGSLFPVDVSLAAFTVNDERFVHATVADITARKQAEKALRELNTELEWKVEARTAELVAARDQAQMANQAKSEFLANMSHEIRTPMNGVLGLAQLLEREPLTADQREMVGRIREGGRSLLAILNDVLDFSKIEAGQLRIGREPFILQQLSDQIGSLLGSTARGKGLGFEIEMPTDLEGPLLGDGLRLEQILINLVGNAIKFTPQGAIRIVVHILESTEAAARLRFEVQDTGIGLTPEQLSTLFMPFTQGDASITRRFGGTGLGLSICKRLVELMGGTIGVESTIAVGSTFWFELPFDRSTAPQVTLPMVVKRPGTEGPRLPGLHCLVADDSASNRLVVERALSREGARITLAVDGLQALQYLRTGSQRFDAVLMDMQMPVLDGLTATRAIRTELGFQHLPVIALTAGVLAEQREQARAAGCNDFVAKPVELEELVAVVLRWTSEAPLVVPLVTEATPNALPMIAGLDTQQVASALGDDRDLFVELLSGFANEFGCAAETTRADLLRDDRDRAARRLHGLRGAAGYIGAVDLVRSAQALETAILDQQTNLAALIDDFEDKLTDLLRASGPYRT